MLIFLLKGLRPEQYRERVALTSDIARLDLNQLPDHLIERIANGENIMSVLASAMPTRKDGSIDTAKLLPALTKREAAVEVEHEDITHESTDASARS